MGWPRHQVHRKGWEEPPIYKQEMCPTFQAEDQTFSIEVDISMEKVAQKRRCKCEGKSEVRPTGKRESRCQGCWCEVKSSGEACCCQESNRNSGEATRREVCQHSKEMMQ